MVRFPDGHLEMEVRGEGGREGEREGGREKRYPFLFTLWKKHFSSSLPSFPPSLPP